MKSSSAARRIRRAVSCVEGLEGRLLLSATSSGQIPTQTLSPGQTSMLKLNQYFNDPQVTGTAIVIQTPEGNIPLALTDKKTPRTVQNFESYINAGEYKNVLINRSVQNFVIQGGGFESDGTATTTFAPVKSEAGTSNTTGTIAMALSNGPATGTNQWFINLGNNTGLDGTADGGPFTVFGSVIYNGMTVVNNIAGLQVVDDSAEYPQYGTAAQGNPFGALPVTPDYTGPNPATSVPPEDRVVTTATVVPALSYSVSVGDPTIASATITNGNLSVTPATGATSGSTSVTLTATDLGGGIATLTFPVNVSNSTLTVVTVGPSLAKSVNYTDANGTLATISMKGPGTVAVIFSGTDIVNTTNKNNTNTVTGTGTAINSITTTGTTAASSLLVTLKGGTKTINVGDVNTDRLNALIARGVVLAGNFESSDVVNNVTVGGAAGGTISGPSISNFTASGSVSDNVTLVGAGFAIGKFSAGQINGGTWQLDSVKSITAGAISGWTPTFTGSISSLTSKGAVSGTITASSIGSMHVKGDLSNTTLNLTGGNTDVGNLAVTGQISNSMINATGNLGTISALALVNSEIYAGIAPLDSGQALPNFPSEFATNQSIAAVKLRVPKTGQSFFNSDIAAQSIGTLSLGTMLTNNGGITTGIASEKINTFIAIFAPKHVHLSNLTSATNVASELSAMGVDVGDIVIKLF